MVGIRLLKIQRLKPDQRQHFPGIIEMEEDAFGIGGVDWWSLPVFVRYGCVYILVKGEKTVGVCELMRCWDDSDTVYLYGVTIARDHRGQGLGNWFLGQILSDLRDSGYKKVILTVAPGNAPAIRLYKKYGFTLTASLEEEYGPGEDRVVMTLDLQ